MADHCSNQQSVFLHSVKIVATAAVFLGHATRPDVLFDLDVSLLGRATIPVFFMVCAYFTTMSFARDGEFQTAIGRRYFNLYFMFLPAAVLVLAMDLWLIHRGSPISENYKFDPDFSAGRIAVEFLQLLTFSGEYWSGSTIGQGIFSNQAMWFVDYMMAYTVMTGAWYLLRGAKRYAVVMGAAVIAEPDSHAPLTALDCRGGRLSDSPAGRDAASAAAAAHHVAPMDILCDQELG